MFHLTRVDRLVGRILLWSLGRWPWSMSCVGLLPHYGWDSQRWEGLWRRRNTAVKVRPRLMAGSVITVLFTSQQNSRWSVVWLLAWNQNYGFLVGCKLSASSQRPLKLLFIVLWSFRKLKGQIRAGWGLEEGKNMTIVTCNMRRLSGTEHSTRKWTSLARTTAREKERGKC